MIIDLTTNTIKDTFEATKNIAPIQVRSYLDISGDKMIIFGNQGSLFYRIQVRISLFTLRLNIHQEAYPY